MRNGAGGRGLYTEERKAGWEGVHGGVEEFSRGSKVRQRSNQQRTQSTTFSVYLQTQTLLLDFMLAACPDSPNSSHFIKAKVLYLGKKMKSNCFVPWNLILTACIVSTCVSVCQIFTNARNAEVCTAFQSVFHTNLPQRDWFKAVNWLEWCHLLLHQTPVKVLKR